MTLRKQGRPLPLSVTVTSHSTYRNVIWIPYSINAEQALTGSGPTHGEEQFPVPEVRAVLSCNAHLESYRRCAYGVLRCVGGSVESVSPAMTP